MREKIFLISFDDGCIWDPKLLKLLDQYGMKGTFNLNSGLQDFVWDYNGTPVIRQKLSEIGDSYFGHEIASHSLTHPWLTSLTPPQLSREVGEDCRVLKKTFGLENIGFAVPFTACGEREIRLIRKYVSYIRLSQEAQTFALPADPWHIPIHGLYNQPDIRERIADFAECDLPQAMFCLAGHSYELELNGDWEAFGDLLAYIQSFGFSHMTTMDFVRTYYQGGTCHA